MSTRRLLRAQDGFTLLELLVAMALMLAVFAATAWTFVTFVHQSAQDNRRTAAEDQARSAVDLLAASLRTAGPTATSGARAATVVAAGPTDVVLNTTDWPTRSGSDTGPHVVRYCVDPSSRTLYFDGLLTYDPAAAAPGAACPSAQAGWTHRVLATNVVNSAARPLFRYDSATTSAIRSIGVDLAIDATWATRARSTALQTAVTMRSRSNTAPAVSPGDVTTTCNDDHTGLLTLGVTSDQNGDPLVAIFSEGGLSLGQGTRVGFGTGPHTITVTVTNVLGLSSVLTKQVQC